LSTSSHTEFLFYFTFSFATNTQLCQASPYHPLSTAASHHCSKKEVIMSPAKPVLQPLKTPKSANFPSEIHSGSLSSLSDVKQEEGVSTPITPPLSYTEFLKALTPVFTSPVSPGAGFPKYPMERSLSSSVSQPSTATSSSFSSSEGLKSAKSVSHVPESPLETPQSARMPGPRRRLRISTSRSHLKSFSPITDSPRSANTLRSPFSPSEWKLRYFEAPMSACDRTPMNIKHVVTQTVTYKRTSLDPPPKGKRRRTSDA
jgi:hypothetical protein